MCSEYKEPMGQKHTITSKKVGTRQNTSDLAVLCPVLAFLRLTPSPVSSEHYIMEFKVLDVISETNNKF